LISLCQTSLLICRTQAQFRIFGWRLLRGHKISERIIVFDSEQLPILCCILSHEDATGLVMRALFHGYGTFFICHADYVLFESALRTDCSLEKEEEKDERIHGKRSGDRNGSRI